MEINNPNIFKPGTRVKLKYYGKQLEDKLTELKMYSAHYISNLCSEFDKYDKDKIYIIDEVLDISYTTHLYYCINDEDGFYINVLIDKMLRKC